MRRRVPTELLSAEVRAPPRCNVLIVLVLVGLWSPSTWADDSRPFNIPAQPLAPALLAFQEQAQVAVIFSDELVREHATSGLTGTHTRDAALEKLLAGTGLRHQWVRENTIAVSEVSRGTLPGTGPPAAPAVPETRVGLEEIVVTARRRAELLQSTPVSVTVITPEDLRGASARELNDLSFLAPNLQAKMGPTAESSFTAIRGLQDDNILVTSEPPVALYLDDVYMSRWQDTAPPLFDIERIEVLRGPQGVLFGKNTTGGAIKLDSKRPVSTPGGFARLRLGPDRQRDVEAALNLPILGETLSARIAFLSTFSDGLVNVQRFEGCPGLCGALGGDFQSQLHDRGFTIQPFLPLGAFTFTGEGIEDQFELRGMGGRGTLLWSPTDTLEVTGSFYSYERRSSPNPAVVAAVDPVSGLQETSSGFVPFDVLSLVAAKSEPYNVFMNFDARNDTKSRGGSVHITQEFGSAELQSITGWRSYDAHLTQDNDGTPWGLNHSANRLEVESFSQELRLTGTALGDRLTYVLGAYGSDQDHSRTQRVRVLFGLLNTQNRPRWEVRSWAAYLHASYALKSRWRVWAGIRPSYEWGRVRQDVEDLLQENPLFGDIEEKDLDLDDRWDAVTWSAGVDFQATDNLFLYANAAKGFRSGGFNTPVVASQGHGDPPSSVLPFDEDFATTYEIGAKSEWLDDRLRVNLAGFFTKHKNVQMLVPTPAWAVRGNAGSADISGGEMELAARLHPELLLQGTLGWTWFRYKTGPLSGGPPRVANWKGGRNRPLFQSALTYTLMAQYTPRPLSFGLLSAQLSWRYQSKQHADQMACGHWNAEVTEPVCGVPISVIEPGDYGVLNGRISLFLDRWNTEVAIFGVNLFNREYFNSGSKGYGWSGVYTRSYGFQRRIGVELTYRFGSDAR